MLAGQQLSSMPQARGTLVERQMYPDISPRFAPSTLDQIRRAARNRFLVLVEYKGSERLVEAYSLRYPATGNEILHVWEVRKNGMTSNRHKSYNTSRLTYLSASDKTFTPKWQIEL